MSEILTLKVTPSIRRIALAFLGFDLWNETNAEPWHALQDVDDGTSDWLPALPLHVPAGLAIARLRLAEVAPKLSAANPDMDAREVRISLVEIDPELSDVKA